MRYIENREEIDLMSGTREERDMLGNTEKQVG